MKRIREKHRFKYMKMILVLDIWDQTVNTSEPWPSINTGLDNVHVICCIYEQEACYVINILYIVTVY